MSSLPSVTGKEAIKAFSKVGFAVVRIEGAHHIMKKAGHKYLLSVPVHGKQAVKRGTLRKLIADAGLTVDEFVKLLD